MNVQALLRTVIAALVLLVAPVAAADVTLTGQVTYRERIALPEGAELWVTLVSLPDAAPVAGAAAITSGTGQVPLTFVLNVRSAALKPGTSYGLLAQIRAGGRTLFRNDDPVPVDPTLPELVEILTTFAPDPIVASPPDDMTAAPAVGPLPGTNWQVTSIGGDPVLSQTPLTLSIGPDLRAGGHGGCNSYVAETELDETFIVFGPIAGTRMACALDVMSQEGRLFAALEATTRFVLAGDALQLQDAAGVTLMGLVRAP